ncbi:MAG TPA: hypothetical protein VNM92_10830 [Thermoanaerobaculia bacterium]|nr:hypothetical protein [Thermoanaerobaculia bacterium]
MNLIRNQRTERTAPMLPGVLLFLALAVLSGCKSAAPVATAPPVERVATRALIDPRAGATAVPRIAPKFDKAWQAFSEGRIEEAERGFNEILGRTPTYGPATLALAAVRMEQGELDRAQLLIEDVRAVGSAPAAGLYAAELAYLRRDLENAFTLYSRALTELQGGEVAGTKNRLETIRKELFAARLAAARDESSDEKAIRSLRSALVLEQDSRAARTLLVQRLIELKRFDEARRELDPLITGEGSESDEIQQALAEIDAGKGRYQDAINRYERVMRKSPDAPFAGRLNELKQQWTDSNMPRHYQQALDSPSINRANLSVLIYWKLSSVRFAQRLAEPPIAIDTDVAGRDELIRALALRLLPVDPVTRRVEPHRTVTGSNFLRMAARLLSLRGTPACAGGVTEGVEAARASRLLAACGIATDEVRDGDPIVSGRAAAKILERLDRRLTGR